MEHGKIWATWQNVIEKRLKHRYPCKATALDEVITKFLSKERLVFSDMESRLPSSEREAHSNWGIKILSFAQAV